MLTGTGPRPGRYGNGLCRSPEIPVCLAGPGNLHRHLWGKVLTAAVLACHFRPKQVTHTPSPGVSHGGQLRAALGDGAERVSHSGTAEGRAPHLRQQARPPNRTGARRRYPGARLCAQTCCSLCLVRVNVN